MKSVDSLMHTEVLKVVDEFKGFTLPQNLLEDDLTQGITLLKDVYLRNVTLELVVEKDALGSLYGRDGTGLDNLQISGARVDVKDPKGVEATVLISGSSEQTRNINVFDRVNPC